MRRSQGFTLLELIIVLLLAGGILALATRAFVSSAQVRDQLAGASQLAGEVSAVLYSINTDASRAGSLSLSPAIALYLADSWPAGLDSVAVTHGDAYDELVFRWAENGACSSGAGQTVIVDGEQACISETKYKVDDQDELLRVYRGSEEPIAGFEMEAFRVFWKTADGWQWDRPSPEDARSIAVYLRASVPYRKPRGCGTFPKPGLLDAYGEAIKDEIGEETYTGDACLRLVHEEVAEFPLVNVQHW